MGKGWGVGRRLRSPGAMHVKMRTGSGKRGDEGRGEGGGVEDAQAPPRKAHLVDGKSALLHAVCNVWGSECRPQAAPSMNTTHKRTHSANRLKGGRLRTHTSGSPGKPRRPNAPENCKKEKTQVAGRLGGERWGRVGWVWVGVTAPETGFTAWSTPPPRSPHPRPPTEE